MPRAHRFGAAPDSLHFPSLGQRIDVTPDGRFGGPEQVQQIANAHDGSFFDQLQNQVMALFFQHLAPDSP